MRSKKRPKKTVVDSHETGTMEATEKMVVAKLARLHQSKKWRSVVVKQAR